MWNTPDDSTAVVRLMQEYERLERPEAGETNVIGRLNFDETPSPRISSSFKAQTSNKGSKTEFQFARRSSKDREKDVALLCAKGRISQLENESKLMMTERKRARIEHEKDSEIRQANLRREIEKNSELQQQLKYIVDEEKNVRDELKGTRKEFEDYKKKAEEKIHGLQRQMLKLNSEVEETKENCWRQLTEMREKLTRQETENIIAQNKLEDNENQLEYYKKRYSEVSKRIEEVEDSYSRCERAEHKVQELEEKLARREEAAEVAMTMQSQISKYYDIECENSKLKEENSYLKATNKSNILLKEKLDSCQSKLKRAEEKLKTLSQLEIECEKQRDFMKKWEIDGVDGNMRSPDELLQEIARLQRAHVVLLQKHGQASTNARISTDALRQKSEDLLDLKLKLADVEEKYSEQSEQMKRQNKLLSLVTTERNGCRSLLNSYDNGDSTNYTSQLTSRVQQAEEQLQACNSHIEQLEHDLKISMEKSSDETAKYNKLKIEYDALVKQDSDMKKLAEEANVEQEKSITKYRRKMSCLADFVDTNAL